MPVYPEAYLNDVVENQGKINMFYFFDVIGMNSSFSCIPKPCASFFTIFRLGFRVPFSIRLISACVIPVLADKSFWVIFC